MILYIYFSTNHPKMLEKMEFVFVKHELGNRRSVFSIKSTKIKRLLNRVM